MDRIARLLFAILLAVAAAGCESAYTARPIGKTSVSLSPKAWEGLWIGELDREFDESDEPFSFPVVLKVLDEQRGILQAWMMAEDGKKYTAHAIPIHVRAYGHTLFASWHLPEDPDTDNYLWGVLRKSGGKMVLYLPDANRFHALLEDKTIPGTLDPRGDVRLGELSDDQLDRIAKSGDLFIQNPIVFTRWESQARPAAFPRAPRKDATRTNTEEILKAEVRWAGIVANEGFKEVPSQGAPSGTTVILDERARSGEETDKIPARLGTKFGVKYALQGAPEGVYAGIREVWRFPVPGITNQKTGKTSHEQVDRAIVQVTDKEIFSGYALLYDWELVPGIWTFEVWTGERLLLKQRFDVYRP
jgi:hypothetical protein